MKNLIFTITVPLFFFLFTPESEAQVVRRHRARVVMGKPTVKVAGQRMRTRRRVRRRTYRRIARRTLHTIPIGTRALLHKKTKYYPINGYYFIRKNAGYVSVLPPIGFRVATIPWAYSRIMVSGRSYFYANGIYYQQVGKYYEISEPPIGARITDLPEEYEEKTIDGKTYYAFDDQLYVSSEKGYRLVGFLDDES
ncbi:DUF6515 family protein [Costertonia aggregata]|uniref:Uncharacterized protein n=1 Tax=Costertonia aggregata TaxID=343403 RepID=A0A7H9AQ46_9FLAO|nr:DUF6515 family protein [Costertonia aggregata]QLG45375.1 hypothetical protein HYG79_08450 [Costertonia aggregata]